jgi:(p)ppGpp synthase/HD superfamily hydrolase
MDALSAVLAAADQAAAWHRDHRRKGASQEPYINHLLEVARLVAEATGGRDPDLVIAALLHDAIEDCGVTEAEIATRFGPDVAALVAAVTDDKALPKAERKRRQIQAAPAAPPRVALLKLADKVSNLRSMRTSPPANWPLERQREYIDWARAVVAGLRGTPKELRAAFDAAVEAAQSAIQER